jgi:hypothetical protein
MNLVEGENIISIVMSEVEKIVVDYLGFKFNPSKKLNNYKNTFDSIDLGPIFEEICSYLEIDSALLSRAVKEYVIHILYEEISTFSNEELSLIKTYSDLWSPNNSVVAENEYFINPDAFFEHFTEIYLCDLVEIEYYKSIQNSEIERNRIRSELTKIIFPKISDKILKSQSIDDIWYQYAKKSGSLYRNLFKRKFNIGEMTLTRQIGNIVNKTRGKDDSKAFYINAIESTDLFLNKLMDIASEHDINEELRMFEKDTDMLLIFDILHKITFGDKNKYNRGGLKIVSSFVLIEDYEIRKVLLSSFNNESGPYIKYLHLKGYSYFFLLNCILIPFLIVFLRTKLYNYKSSSLKESKLKGYGIDPNVHDDLRRIHTKLSLNQLIKKPRRHTLKSRIKIMKDIRTRITSIESKDKFISLYSSVKGIRRDVDSNKKKSKDFRSFIINGSIEWLEINIENIRENTDGALSYLTDKMAEFFIDIIGLDIVVKDHRVTLESLITDFDIYFGQLKEADVENEYAKFLNGINKKGWHL